MTREETRENSVGENGDFPVGMRVLAVDDDPTCLKLLDALLRKCQYKVTTASQAKVALRMLRKNRNSFDLIISDVHMPDMDGFKLLELVGLEMDLPVVMLSAYGDKELVRKGIQHGACDYLLKPVRIEELKNIWQHIVRKNVPQRKQSKRSNSMDKDPQENGKSVNGSSSNGSSDENGKRNRKRKNEKEDEEEEEGGEENGSDSEELCTQKKPRVVWSMELHNKFVEAVNQLGIGKEAVPKRILELMNVEGLTRENVASHLQKYRLFLKKISTGESNTFPGLGTQHQFMGINSSERVEESRTTTPPQGMFSNSSLSSYASGRLLNRHNNPSYISLQDLSSSPLIQPNHVPSISNSISTLNQTPSLIQANSTNYIRNNTQRNALSSSPLNEGVFGNLPFSRPVTLSSEPFNGELLNFSSNPSLIPNTSPVGHIQNNGLDLSFMGLISRENAHSRLDSFGNLRTTNNLVPFNSVLSPISSQSSNQNNGWFQQNVDLTSMNNQNVGLQAILQRSSSENLARDPELKPNGDSLDVLDELINSMTKGGQEGNLAVDVEFGIDAYTY